MPTPAEEGVTVSSEKIWSQDTGRTSSGKMVGTIIGIKKTISIKWPPLTPSEVDTIESAVSDVNNPFTSLKYTDINGKTVTKEVYFGTPTGTWDSWENGRQYVTDYTVNAIER